jgi:hypothetical protein
LRGIPGLDLTYGLYFAGWTGIISMPLVQGIASSGFE